MLRRKLNSTSEDLEVFRRTFSSILLLLLCMNSVFNSELTHPAPTDTDSCHELNRYNATDGNSGMDHMDDSASDTSDHYRDRPAGVMSDTLDLFGRYVSSILQQLPVSTSYTLQQKFINEAISAKLDYEKEHPSKSPRQTMAESQPRSEYPTVNG